MKTKEQITQDLKNLINEKYKVKAANFLMPALKLYKEEDESIIVFEYEETIELVASLIEANSTAYILAVTHGWIEDIHNISPQNK